MFNNQAMSQSPSGDLESLLDEMFPGTAMLTIDGAVTSFYPASCDVTWPFPPQGRSITPDPQPPITYWYDSFFAKTFVTDSADTSMIFPAIVHITVFVSNGTSTSEYEGPVLKRNIAAADETTGLRASAEVTVLRGDSEADQQEFRFEPDGAVFVEYLYGRADEYRIAFDFTVKDQERQAIRVRGAIHNVNSWVRYRVLSEGQTNFVTLSGDAYAVTDEVVIQITESTVDGTLYYTVQLDTMAEFDNASAAEKVSVSVVFIANVDSEPGYSKITQAEVSVDGKVLPQYTALNSPGSLSSWAHIVTDDEVASGEASMMLGDGCGNFLLLDILFQEVLLKQE